MPSIVALLQCLDGTLATTLLHQLEVIVLAQLTMTGRVTMAGMARWSGSGGSYRTIQRFFQTPIAWATLLWLLFRAHRHQPSTTYLLAGDEVVVTKAGKQTHGVDRFFSSIAGKPVPSVAFFSLALVNVTERRAYPMALEQIIRTPEEKATSTAKAKAKQAKAKAKATTAAAAKPRRPGRPKGSKNRPKIDLPLSPELQRIGTMIGALMLQATPTLTLTYLLLDGHFGNAAALQMARQQNLHLISKLRADSALFFPYDGPYAGHGPRRRYGDKLDYRMLPETALQTTTLKDGISTRIYKAQLRHREFPQLLNVVIIHKTNQQTGKGAHVILFSSDGTLNAALVIDYYSLRFQIEFTFRDAKQHWGMEDFMHVTPTGVTNAANLSLFMVTVAAAVVGDQPPLNADASMLDLKTTYRGRKYVETMIELLPEKPDPILFDSLISTITDLGRIHPRQSAGASP